MWNSLDCAAESLSVSRKIFRTRGGAVCTKMQRCTTRKIVTTAPEVDYAGSVLNLSVNCGTAGWVANLPPRGELRHGRIRQAPSTNFRVRDNPAAFLTIPAGGAVVLIKSCRTSGARECGRLVVARRLARCDTKTRMHAHAG